MPATFVSPAIVPVPASTALIAETLPLALSFPPSTVPPGHSAGASIHGVNCRNVTACIVMPTTFVSPAIVPGPANTALIAETLPLAIVMPTTFVSPAIVPGSVLSACLLVLPQDFIKNI